MRKLIIAMNLTLDGYMAGPAKELDWHLSFWSTGIAAAFNETLSRADTIVLGRVTYCAMADYFLSAGPPAGLTTEDRAFITMLHRCQKIVFSKQRIPTRWQHTIITRQEATTAIGALKRLPGDDILLYGSGTLAASLIRAAQVDEYRLWLYPVVLGKGRPLFPCLPAPQHLQLAGTRAFSSGVIEICYRPATPFPDGQPPAVLTAPGIL